MLDIFALTFSLFGIAAFLFGFRQKRPHLAFALSGFAFGLSAACKWSGLFPFATCILIVAAIRLLQGWRTQFADARESDWYDTQLWPEFKAYHFVFCFIVLPLAAYLPGFVVLYGFSIPDLIEAQQRIFFDNTTTAIAGHTYMSSWPSWPFLVRPVWFLFDNLGDGVISATASSRRWCVSAIRWCCGRRWPGSRFARAISSSRDVLTPCWRWPSISVPGSPGRCCPAPSGSCIIICRRQRPRASSWCTRCGVRARSAGCYGRSLRSRRWALP
jgi:hypothetical protein